jgi:predicted N-acetyltransferase YhbS
LNQVGIRYEVGREISPRELASLFLESGISRPVGDEPRLAEMLRNCNLLVTAWDANQLVGVARALTDFAYCCYVSDLAVSRAYQRRGIGKALLEIVQEKVGEGASVILLSAPGADAYYARVGFSRAPNAWVIRRTR